MPNPTTTADVHVFDTSGEAYNQSQWDDLIKDGDVLLVPSEGVAGWLDRAWPVAATTERGEFHGLNETGRAMFEDKIAEVLAAYQAHLQAATEADGQGDGD